MKVSRITEDRNAEILISLIDKYGNGYIDCSSIKYYVDGEQIFSKPGRIRVNRIDRFPNLKILEPDTGDYTETFQENSCVFEDVADLEIIMIETNYTPYAIGKNVDIKVIISF